MVRQVFSTPITITKSETPLLPLLGIQVRSRSLMNFFQSPAIYHNTVIPCMDTDDHSIRRATFCKYTITAIKDKSFRNTNRYDRSPQKK